MADYNVQMKQFNGTSFDNILPYASQALTLAGGGGATEIIAQARAGLSQIATGSYVGNGQTTLNIVVGFKPKLVLVQENSVSAGGSTSTTFGFNYSLRGGDSLGSWRSMFYLEGFNKILILVPYENRSRGHIYQEWTTTSNGFSVEVSADASRWDSYATAYRMCNDSGVAYQYIAFG